MEEKKTKYPPRLQLTVEFKGHLDALRTRLWVEHPHGSWFVLEKTARKIEDRNDDALIVELSKSSVEEVLNKFLAKRKRISS